MNRAELFKKFIKSDEELSRNIYTSISYVQFNIIAPYKVLSRDNYVEKLIGLISSNRRLRDLINETIFEISFKYDQDIITKIFKSESSITGIKPILEKILLSVKENILKNYLNNENDLRDILEPDEIDKKKNSYFDTLLILNNSLLVLINKEERLKNILNIFQNKYEEEKKYMNY